MPADTNHESAADTLIANRDAQAKLDALLDAAVDAIIVIDHLGIIESFNRAAALMFGYQSGEVIGQNINILMPEPYKTEHDSYIDNYKRSGSAKIIGIGREVLAQRKNGEIFSIELSVGAVTGSSHRQFVGIIRDISDVVKDRKEIRENREKLLHISRISTMGEMAAGLAHEINQPLTAVATYAQACYRLLGSDKADKAKLLDVLEKINAQALRAGEVIKRLRLFVKKGAQTREAIDARHLIRDAVRLVQMDTRLSKDCISLELPKKPVPIVADVIQIQQVLVNLIQNAADAVENCREAPIVISLCTKGKEWVQVSVADQGEGVKDIHVGSLFDPFFTTKTTGMGMGLKICQTIVTAHGGKLWHSPANPKGSIFTFSLPAAPTL